MKWSHNGLYLYGNFFLNPLFTGTVATCPEPDPLPNDPGVDYRLCNNGTALCVNGVSFTFNIPQYYSVCYTTQLYVWVSLSIYQQAILYSFMCEWGEFHFQYTTVLQCMLYHTTVCVGFTFNISTSYTV